ncbi:MAG: glycosyltransferase family 2 protein [Alphaproteobacteria bacterium]|nr:glycosyltransferase family 2 protein [Alphaproteobacteria bacterium]
MSSQNGVHGYRLFLGRDPESRQVAEERALLPLDDSISNFIASAEFEENVLSALLNNRALPHFRISVFPGPEIVDWVASELPLDEATRSAIRKARTWRQILSAVLRDPVFFVRVCMPAGEEIAARIRDKRPLLAGLDASREIAGAIDDVSAFEIRGWAANFIGLDEPVRVEILLDNAFVGVTECNRFRRDLQDAFGGPGTYGFSFIIPAAHHRLLQTERLLSVRDAVTHAAIAMPKRVNFGQSQVFDSMVEIRRELGLLKTALGRIENHLPSALDGAAFPLSMYDDYGHETDRLLATSRRKLEQAAARLAYRPLISVIIADDGEDTRSLSRSLASLERQIYPGWECVVVSSSPAPGSERDAFLQGAARSDARVRAPNGTLPGNEAAAFEKLFNAAEGEYVLALGQGDVLSDDALLQMATHLQANRAGLVYFDEDAAEVDEAGDAVYHTPVLKPDFDYDFLLANDYIGARFAFRKALLAEIGGSNRAPDALFLDLLLRLVEKLKPEQIVHINRVLYHRFAPFRGEEPGTLDCIRAHLERAGRTAEVRPHADALGRSLPNCQRVQWGLPETAPKVSIIVPTRDRAELLDQCIQSVLASRGAYPGEVEIIVMDNDSCEQKTHELFKTYAERHGVRVIPFNGRFNWSAINNLAARHATGEVLVFLNNDTVVLSQDWLAELVSTALRPEVGVVGARLLYEDGTVQHAGVLIGVSGGAVHEGMGELPSDGGYLGRTVLQRNVLAVTGACMATRAALFDELGGFDEIYLRVEFNDTDYCLRARDRGYAVVYEPFATLYHFESKSRGYSKTNEDHMRSLGERAVLANRWRKYFDRDPFYNAHFDRLSRPFSRLQPVVMMPDGRV